MSEQTSSGRGHRPARRSRRLAAGALALLPVVVAAVTTGPGAASAENSPRPSWSPATRTQTVRILGIGEFAGALDRPVGYQGELRDGSGNVQPAGGGPHLAATIDKLRAQADGSLLLTTGDSIGGTGPENAMLGDRPTVEFLDRLGVDASAVGERDLERGTGYLSSLVDPGCRTPDQCPTDPPLAPFRGATFPLVASNAEPAPGAAPTLPFAIHKVGDVRVGVVAATLPEVASGSEETFSDAAGALDRSADTLRFLGVDTIVALVHGTPVHGNLAPGQCPPQLAEQHYLRDLSPSIDAIVVGESGGPATCRLTDSENAERVVVAPASYGRSVSVVDLAVDTSTGEVVRPQTAVFNQTVNTDIDPAPWATRFAAEASEAAAPASRRPLGESRAAVPRAMDGRGESPLADLVCDAQLEAARPRGAQLALSNPDSLRVDLPAGPLDYATLHDVQPFGDRLHLVTLTGAQLLQSLGHFADDIGRNGAAVSSNVRYTVDRSKPAGARVTDVVVDGSPVDPARSYTVVANEFLVSPEFGGSPLVRPGDRRPANLTDIGALRQYVDAHSPVRAPDTGRISVVG